MEELIDDHACLDFIAALHEPHHETGGKVVMERCSLIGRYTRGRIRAAARRSTPPSSPSRSVLGDDQVRAGDFRLGTRV